MERGIRQRGQKERQGNRLREREWARGRNGFSVGWKCPLEEIENLSIFSNANQNVKQLSIKICVCSEFFG